MGGGRCALREAPIPFLLIHCKMLIYAYLTSLSSCYSSTWCYTLLPHVRGRTRTPHPPSFFFIYFFSSFFFIYFFFLNRGVGEIFFFLFYSSLLQLYHHFLNSY